MTHQERTHHWQQQVDHWRDSGLSGAAFCKQQALSYHQFTYWRRKFQEADNELDQTHSTSGFARVISPPPQRLVN